MKLRLILTSLIILGLSLTLAGCDSGAKKEAELALAKAEAALEQTKQELTAVTQARDSLKEQVVELIRSRDIAVEEVKASKVRIDELAKRYEEQAKIISELQEHMKKMQASIEKL